jgi:hypothetical protein
MIVIYPRLSLAKKPSRVMGTSREKINKLLA